MIFWYVLTEVPVGSLVKGFDKDFCIQPHKGNDPLWIMDLGYPWTVDFVMLQPTKKTVVMHR